MPTPPWLLEGNIFHSWMAKPFNIQAFSGHGLLGMKKARDCRVGLPTPKNPGLFRLFVILVYHLDGHGDRPNTW
jgi:hypothetical protein